MLIFVSFEVTIVVGSVCFSFDIGPRTSFVSFLLVGVTVFVKHDCCSKKGEVKVRSGGFSSLLMMIKSF